MTQKRNDLSRRSLLRALAAAPLAGALSGCGSLVPGQGPPADLYRIQPKPQFPADMPKVDWQLQVPVPVAPASIDTARIALLHNPLRVEYYAKVNWVDRAPVMVQAAIIEGFEGSERILSISRDVADARADYILTTELRDFQAEYFLGPQPQIHAGLIAKLISTRRRSVVATKRFDGLGNAAADRIDDVVGAFADAVAKVLGDLVPWTLAAGEADRKAA
jgi:cholesterol transport system auxiliary component